MAGRPCKQGSTKLGIWQVEAESLTAAFQFWDVSLMRHRLFDSAFVQDALIIRRKPWTIINHVGQPIFLWLTRKNVARKAPHIQTGRIWLERRPEAHGPWHGRPETWPEKWQAWPTRGERRHHLPLSGRQPAPFIRLSRIACAPKLQPYTMHAVQHSTMQHQTVPYSTLPCLTLQYIPLIPYMLALTRRTPPATPKSTLSERLAWEGI